MTKKKKSYIPVGKIKKHLRRLSFQRKEYTQAKNRAKVDKATYECEECSLLMYDGASEKNFTTLRGRYSNIEWVKPEMDHINPVSEPKKGFVSWDEYLDRLFCAPEDLKVLCPKCHQEKTNEDTKKRVKSGSLKRKNNEEK